MVVIAIIGVLAFLIGLLVRAPQRQQAAAKRHQASRQQSPRWYEFTLALHFARRDRGFRDLAHFQRQAVGVGRNHRGLASRHAHHRVRRDHGRAGRYRSWRLAHLYAGPVIAPRPRRCAVRSRQAQKRRLPAPCRRRLRRHLRIFGLLLLVVAIMLLCWIALPSAATIRSDRSTDLSGQPWRLAGAAVRQSDPDLGRQRRRRDVSRMAVLRSAGVSAGARIPQSAQRRQAGSLYRSFWDLLNIVLFFAAFWIVDRTAARGRFLFGYGYLVVLPVLLLIWNAVQGVAAPASWWASMWPFSSSPPCFFVLEAVTLVASTANARSCRRSRMWCSS